MARSARAFAQSPDLPASLEAVALSAVPTIPKALPAAASSAPRRSAEALTLQAGDDTDNLRGVLHAYAALEKLLVPVGANDSDEVYPTRTELSALVRVINDELQRRIETVDVTIHSVREALTENAATARRSACA